MKPLVEICQSNLALGTYKVLEALENDPDLDVDILEYGCLGNCGECFQNPYALVEGELISASTPDELLDKIKKYIKENWMIDIDGH
ncbi:DUF1450 domain-containing protein [Microaerobacter geothermalis]|uniref:DUF1450 domain-containing protein n=1 Tax=Microaerobacter geothermalis TaxID=674972 RepID=UPI001F4709A5|nr:DUF1450 domain-containing protein [Microaerobacter geothermalis]MCF6092439.1 DUF1450 domain-containing protein [Microaerobacter geothermalis]